MTQCVHDSCVHCNVIVRLEKCKKAKIFRQFCGGYRLSPEKERREKENQKFEDAC